MKQEREGGEETERDREREKERKRKSEREWGGVNEGLICRENKEKEE